ncbi:MAG: PilZ domain-containing protein [Candidatus Omnitrophica bacterium]|nr:PilZ domain-containing protein [Candidatus Omnitrophota bacterium]
MPRKLFIQRRRSPRAIYNNERVTLQCGNLTLGAIADDLSITGIGLRAPQLPPPDTPLSVTFRLPERTRPVTLSGVVEWRSSRNGEGYEAGIAFTDIDITTKKQIMEHVTSSEMSDEEKIEFESLRNEILGTANNLVTIEGTTWTVAMAFIGTSLAIDNVYFALIPLFTIELGFRLYKTGLNKCRRIASYIRSYLERQYQRLSWEGHLYHLRKILHEKENRYTLEYYDIARNLSIVCFLIASVKMTALFNGYLDGKTPSSDLMWKGATYLFAGIFWFSNRLPYIKKHNRQGEGADKLEEKYFRYWQRIQACKNGLCKDLFHTTQTLNVFFADRPLYTVKEIKKICCERSCYTKESCRMFPWVEGVMKRLEEATCYRGRFIYKRMNWFLMALMVIAAGELWYFIRAAYPAWQRLMDAPFWENHALLYAFSSLIRQPLGVGLLILLLAMAVKVRIRQRFFPLKTDNGLLLVDREWLLGDSGQREQYVSDAINDLEETKEKIVTLPSWAFCYGFRCAWTRKKISFLTKTWGRESRYPVRHFWLPMEHV